MKITNLHCLFLENPIISTDSRNIVKGSIFFALKGNKFDGNNFAIKAIEKGAIVSIIDNPKFATHPKCILVDDVLNYLQNLAKLHRVYLNNKIIAITGTNGKTTTKELIKSVLSPKYSVLATEGNLNNHIGVPITILKMNKSHEIGIVEMGASKKGDIMELCKIATPNYGIITNVGKAHLEGFQTFDKLKKTKKELYDFINKVKGTIFINNDNTILKKMAGEKLEQVLYGSSNKYYCFGKLLNSNPFVEISILPDEKENFVIKSKMIGEYNAENILAACTVGKYFEVENEQIKKAIEEYEPQNLRSQLLKTAKNTLIIDAYNANPTSMEVALKSFENIQAQNKIAIIGDMLELGKTSEKEHINIAEYLKKMDLKKCFLIGKNFMKTETDFIKFGNTDNFIKYLINNKLEGFTILVKASRGIGLEKVIKYL